MENIGYYYYRQYFKGIDFSALSSYEKEFIKRNSELTACRFDRESVGYFRWGNLQHISAVTQYPGLFTGAGMGHEVGGKGELKLGFYFDYTTGMPGIPGSSVKGLLRSVFPQWKKQKNVSLALKKEKTKYILGIIDRQDYTDKEIGDEERKRVNLIESEIFDGICGQQALSVYDRDIFWDAYISRGTSSGCLLGTDSITPHVREGLSYSKSMLKNPNPLLFLKILPDVRLEFQFDLKDHSTLDERLLNIPNKLELFKTILEDMGAGAKTNVGYGQFKQVALSSGEPDADNQSNSNDGLSPSGSKKVIFRKNR